MKRVYLFPFRLIIGVLSLAALFLFFHFPSLFAEKVLHKDPWFDCELAYKIAWLYIKHGVD